MTELGYSASFLLLDSISISYKQSLYAYR